MFGIYSNILSLPENSLINFLYGLFGNGENALYLYTTSMRDFVLLIVFQEILKTGCIKKIGTIISKLSSVFQINKSLYKSQNMWNFSNLTDHVKGNTFIHFLKLVSCEYKFEWNYYCDCFYWRNEFAL